MMNDERMTHAMIAIMTISVCIFVVAFVAGLVELQRKRADLTTEFKARIERVIYRDPTQ